MFSAAIQSLDPAARSPPKHAVTKMPAAIMEGMVTNQLQLTDIDMVIPHDRNR